MFLARRRRRRWQRALVGLVAILAVGLTVHFGLLPTGWLKTSYLRLTREVAWALGTPEKAYNFGVVVPGRVYRSAQPDERFIRYVDEKYGVDRVISLNGRGEFHSTAQELGLTVDVLFWKVFQPPPRWELDYVLDALDEEAPVLVNCSFGRNRTGYAIGAYRVLREDWPVERALEELDRFGCDFDESPWIDVELGVLRSEAKLPAGDDPSARLSRGLAAEADP